MTNLKNPLSQVIAVAALLFTFGARNPRGTRLRRTLQPIRRLPYGPALRQLLLLPRNLQPPQTCDISPL
jgi:hypothetical protein